MLPQHVRITTTPTSSTQSQPVEPAATEYGFTSGGYRFSGRTYAFHYDPPQSTSIDVDFVADWTSPRSRGTCWLNIPKMLGGGSNDPSLLANVAIGHGTDWTRDAYGFPLTHALVELPGSASDGYDIDVTTSLRTLDSLDHRPGNAAQRRRLKLTVKRRRC